MSSLTSKLVLSLSCAITAGIVTYVHMKQQADRFLLSFGRSFGILKSLNQVAGQLPQPPLGTPMCMSFSSFNTRALSYRDKMHEGVVKDMERQQKRKIENVYILEKQNELAKQMKKDLNS